MYNKEFWKKIEIDRKNGMTVSNVCKKYHIIPQTLRNARYKGWLKDNPNLSNEQANEIRKNVSQMDPKYIVSLHDRCGSVNGVMNELNLTKSTTNLNLIKNILIECGVKILTRKRIGEETYSKETFTNMCAEVYSFTELSRNLGLTVHTSNNRKFKELIRRYDIDISHWSNNVNKRTYTYDEIFCKNSRIPRTTLRDKILRFSVIDLTKCSQCGTSEWQDQPLKIQVDHINGISSDNRINNLRGLCPNCHSLTATYGGKHRKL